jgi:hypothetical protein
VKTDDGSDAVRGDLARLVKLDRLSACGVVQVPSIIGDDTHLGLMIQSGGLNQQQFALECLGE